MIQLKKRLRRLLAHPFILDATLTALSIGARATKDGLHIVLPAPGRGNIGDAAMLEAFTDRVDGSIVATVRAGSDFPSYSARTRAESFSSLLYGRVPQIFGDAIRFRRLITQSRSFSVVGADIMDGAYNSGASCRRAILAKHAARAGLNARVLGFSWNAAPTKSALRTITSAAAAGVQLHVRDPASAQRLRDAEVQHVHEVADIVFTTPTRTPLPDDIRLPDNAYIVVNASSYVARKEDTLTAYVALVRKLIADGFEVALVPHVVRHGGDPAVTREIYRSLPEDDRARTLLVDRMLMPGQIRELAFHAHAVVTGRMHLAVMALRQLVPTVVVGTQGKVDGMMKLFALEEYVVQPDAIAEGALTETTQHMLENDQEVRQRIANAVPNVVRLAEGNFNGLPLVDAPSSTPDEDTLHAAG